jgi:predicted small metal-binding protein
MKQMTCAQIGGPATCTVMISGSTPEEMVGKGMGHIKQAHPEMASDIMKMPREKTEEWFAEFKKKWDKA